MANSTNKAGVKLVDYLCVGLIGFGLAVFGVLLLGIFGIVTIEVTTKNNLFIQSAEDLRSDSILIENKKVEHDFESMSFIEKNTWLTVTDVLYRELGAYEINFELTDDPQKNCAQNVHNSKGGCFHPGGEYTDMIFVSPDISENDTYWIAHHEYAHYEQKYHGLRYSDDAECDANLRVFARLGKWDSYHDDCLKAGFEESDLVTSNLATIERNYAASKR